MNENLSQEQITALISEATIEETPPKQRERRQGAKLRQDKEALAPPETESAVSAESAVSEDAIEKVEPSVQPAVFEELSKHEETDTPVAGMDALLDVPLSVSVELGRARCRVKDLLNLTIGSVVELDKSAGENVDVLINGKLFAHGEVVVVDENFGVRITDIISKGAIGRSARKVT